MRELTIKDYTIEEVIGRGSYASVHRAINNQTKQICAIKKINLFSDSTQLAHEIDIIKGCKCKNIVNFLDSYIDIGHVYIVMEYCCAGSVKDVMRDLSTTLNSDQIRVVLRDILNGLNYLHSIKQIHRDVKAANILLNEEGVAKLADFGVSEPKPAPDVSRNSSTNKKSSLRGTLLWLPPEVLNQNPDYGLAIDIWSLGITIIEMGDGQPPFSDLKQEVALDEIRNLNKSSPTFRDPTRWPVSLLHFISLCLDKDPTRRKSANDLLNHETVTSAPNNEIIRDLVLRVCSNRSASLASETELYRKSEHLLKECANSFAKYKERMMKVIMVDQMTNSLVALEEEFKELQRDLTRRSFEIRDIQTRSRAISDENMELERERNELRSRLDNQRERKMHIQDELEKIREKQRVRRMKLQSLESKSN